MINSLKMDISNCEKYKVTNFIIMNMMIKINFIFHFMEELNYKLKLLVNLNYLFYRKICWTIKKIPKCWMWFYSWRNQRNNGRKCLGWRLLVFFKIIFWSFIKSGYYIFNFLNSFYHHSLLYFCNNKNFFILKIFNKNYIY